MHLQARRALRPLLAAGLLVALLPALGASAAGCAGVTRSGEWDVVRLPSSAAGMVVHAVAPAAPTTAYVSDGTVLHRTTDGGCRWQEVWRVPAAATPAMPYASGTAQVVQVAVAPSRPDRVIVLVQNAFEAEESPVGGSNPGRLHVVRSDDGGTTWAAADEGLAGAVSGNARREPLTSKPAKDRCGDTQGCAVRISASDPDVLYLFGDVDLFTPAQLYRSLDGGRSWQPRSALGDVPGTAGGLPGGEMLAVDPGDPQRLFSSLTGRFSVSADGGSTWAARHRHSIFNQLLTVQGSPSRPARVLHLKQSPGASGGTGATEGLRSDDGGDTFREVSLNGLSGQLVESLASGQRADDLVALSSKPAALQVWAPRRGRWVNVDTADLIPRLGPASDVQAHRAGFTVLTAQHLLTYRGPVGVDLAPVRTTTVRPRSSTSGARS